MRNLWKLGSNKAMRERSSQCIQRAFEKNVEIRFKQNYERTAKVVYTNGFREKCGKQVQTRI